MCLQGCGRDGVCLGMPAGGDWTWVSEYAIVVYFSMNVNISKFFRELKPSADCLTSSSLGYRRGTECSRALHLHIQIVLPLSTQQRVA